MSQRGDDDNEQFLAADDAKYEEMQLAIKTNLLAEQKRLQEELQGAQINRKRVHKSKQQIGVRLYTAQQQLASNQIDYEKAHDNYNIAQRLRIQSEQKLAQINQLYNAKKQQMSILKTKVQKAQKQLENLMKHYHEIQAYNVQLKSDIAVTKIETFTAEDNVANLEKIKKQQDLLIDSMNEESKRLQEQKNILGAQIISQKQQTEQAKKILRQAQIEMQKVQASKKNLLDRWQKGIMMMQKRDERMQDIRRIFQNQRKKRLLVLNELSGYRTEIRKQEEQTEKLGAQSNLIAKQKNALEIAKNELIARQRQISEQLMMLKQSLLHTEEDIKITDQQKKSLNETMTSIENNIMKLHTATNTIQDKLVDQKSEHTTIEKTAGNLLKQARNIQVQIEQKEIELQNLMNEIARVKIDQLNTKSEIQLLQQKKKEQQNNQNEKKYLVITYEVQIRQGHDINEKKQHQVGRLNKLHDQLSKNDYQSINPKQIKLKNLTRQSQDLEIKCTDFYRDWIKKQTILVHENNKLQQYKENVTDLENKKTIIQQKKIRLSNNYKGFQREIFDIKISLKGLQQEMNKLNDNIAVNSEKKHKLENQKINLQSQFAQKLKQMQAQAIKFEINIDQIRQQKAQLMNEIVQCQRQILLWQRKYQLQKEMQQALDPNVGQSEIQDLKKELHRMQLKHNSLLKQQSKINTEMIRSVNKKSDIEMKYQALNNKKQSVKQKQPQTSNQLKNQLRKIKQNQAKTMKSLQETDKNLIKKEKDLGQINEALEKHNADLNRIEVQTHQLQTDRVLAKIRKNTDVLKLATLQKKYKKLDDISNRNAKLMYQQPILREKLGQIKQKNNDLYVAVEQLGQKYMQYRELLYPLLQTNSIGSEL